MIIVSKFDGRCIACGKAIRAGERVSWIKGRKGAEHAACSTEGQATAVQVAESRAEVSDLEVPAPPGLSYLPYQRAGVAYMLGRPGVILADEMGLGKTVQICGLMNADASIRTALIICPKSLTLNWQRELNKWLVPERFPHGGVGRVGVGAGWEYCAILIASFEQAKNAKFRPVLEARGYDLVAIDEAHRAKNKTRATTKAQRDKQIAAGEVDKDGKAKVKRVAVQRTEAVRALLGRARKRALLSGTPFENRPIELFPLLQMADPTTWDPNGKGFFRFALRYCNAQKRQVSRTRSVWDMTGASNLPELQERLRASCLLRRLKANVLKELPAKRRQIIELEIDGDEVQRADAVLSDGQNYADAAARLVGTMPSFVGASAARVRLGVAKAPAVAEFVQELIEDGCGKVIIGAWHREVIEAIHGALVDAGRRVVVITGDHTSEQRQAAVDAFQNDAAVDAFIGQIDAAGVGLTLTASKTVVLAELPWTPAQASQFEDRAHRIGQKDSVNVYHLVIRDSLEAHMAKVLVAKQTIADAALDTLPEPVPPPDDVEVTAHGMREGKSRESLDVMGALLEPEHVKQIHHCLQLLAAACDGANTVDGAGFNKLDTRIGHALAAADSLTPRQAALGLTLCRKYGGQLSKHGIQALFTSSGKGGK